MQAVIIDYGSGNLRSAAKAFERAARESGVGTGIKVSADPRDVASSTHIVLPGVGAFSDCMNGLRRLPGMIDALTRAVQDDRRPFLGICVGMQLLARQGHEHGTHAGLGWIDGEVHCLAVEGQGLKVPHMGWNELLPCDAPHKLLDGIARGAHAYFVHSYYMALRHAEDALAMTDYGGPIAAIVARGNVAGTQFHPEKSQEAGLRLIANFLRWMP